MDGDGCSHDCHVESGFVCVNGTTTTPSVCSYNGSFTLQLVDTTKSIYSNTVNFEFSIAPALSILNSYDFNSMVVINLPTKAVSCTYSTGSLDIKA